MTGKIDLRWIEKVKEVDFECTEVDDHDCPTTACPKCARLRFAVAQALQEAFEAGIREYHNAKSRIGVNVLSANEEQP